MAHGATDEFGWHAVEDKVHVHDLHATILHLMGLDHAKLTYRYGGPRLSGSPTCTGASSRKSWREGSCDLTLT